MLLDDLRASAMDANDWLLLLDPHNASPARARYKNKGEVAPQAHRDHCDHRAGRVLLFRPSEGQCR